MTSSGLAVLRGGLRAVLFDLDGTLIDSAPDLAAAANAVRAARDLAPLPYEALRPMVGAGARGMLGVAMNVKPGEPAFEALREEFLLRYERGMLERTGIFPFMHPVLTWLESAGLPWGVVTNKAERFARPVMDGLGLQARAGALVAGDTTPHAKPHPAPLIEAARRLGVPASHCVYVGDDLRDVQAGRAAGMRTVAAAWGYLGQGESIDAWNADFIASNGDELLRWLQVP